MTLLGGEGLKSLDYISALTETSQRKKGLRTQSKKEVGNVQMASERMLSESPSPDV